MKLIQVLYWNLAIAAISFLWDTLNGNIPFVIPMALRLLFGVWMILAFV